MLNVNTTRFHPWQDPALHSLNLTQLFWGSSNIIAVDRFSYFCFLTGAKSYFV